MINVEKVKTTGVFTNYIYKAIPLAFDESMSYYETLCGLLAYLKDTILPVINNNADATIELQNMIIELQNYVDNYFENLDVQEEINNKLDEMAEQGQLTDIIAQYLGLAGVLAFNTVTDMKSAENLVNGSTCKTLGFHELNDGGSALYKVRTITNQDVIDESTIIVLNDNTLIAELIIDKDMNVKQFGAYGDGVNADDTYINIAFTKITDGLYFPKGTYLINNPITVNLVDNMYIKLDDNAKITTNNIIDSLFILNNNITGLHFIGGILDANNKAEHCIKTDTNNQYSSIYERITLKDATVSNIKIKDSNNAGGSAHGWMDKLIINNQNTFATGIEIYTHDYSITNCEIFYINTGIITTGQTSIINTHIWPGGTENTNDDTKGIIGNGISHTLLTLSEVYFDGVNTCIDCSTNGNDILINNSIALFPTEGTYNKPLVIKNKSNNSFHANNCYFRSNEPTFNIVGFTNLDLNNFYATNNSVCNVIKHYSGVSRDFGVIDLGENTAIDTNSTRTPIGSYSITFNNDKYYKIGYVIKRGTTRRTSFDLTVFCDDLNNYSQNVKCCINSNDSVLYSKSQYLSANAGRYGLALGGPETLTDNLNNSYTVFPLYLKTINSYDNSHAIAVKNNMKSNGNTVIIFQNTLTTEYSAPTTIAEWTSNT